MSVKRSDTCSKLDWLSYSAQPWRPPTSHVLKVDLIVSNFHRKAYDKTKKKSLLAYDLILLISNYSKSIIIFDGGKDDIINIKNDKNQQIITVKPDYSNLYPCSINCKKELENNDKFIIKILNLKRCNLKSYIRITVYTNQIKYFFDFTKDIYKVSKENYSSSDGYETIKLFCKPFQLKKNDILKIKMINNCFKIIINDSNNLTFVVKLPTMEYYKKLWLEFWRHELMFVVKHDL